MRVEVEALFAVILALGATSPVFGAPSPGRESGDSQPKQDRRVEFGASYRIRGEVQDGFNLLSYGPPDVERFILARLRLQAKVRLSRAWSLSSELQDARVLKASSPDGPFIGRNRPYRDPLDINKAFQEYRRGRSVRVTAGRQSLSLGGRRVFGPGDWGNTGCYAWDALLVQTETKPLDSTWLVGRPIVHDPHRWPNRTAGGRPLWPPITS